MSFTSTHLKPNIKRSFSNVTLTVSLTLFLLLMSCFENPSGTTDAENSNINLILISSSKQETEELIVDTVGNEIEIVVAFIYPAHIKTTTIQVLNENDEREFEKNIISTSKSTLYTSSIAYKLTLPGVKKIIATAYIDNGDVKSDTVLCSVAPRSSPLNSAPKVTIDGDTIVAAGDVCTLSVVIKDSDAGQTHTTVVIQNGTRQPVNQSKYIWKVPIDAPDSDTLLFIVSDNGSPSLSDSDTVVITITRIIPDAPTVVNVASRDGNTITLSWDVSPRAEYYQLYISNSREGKYTLYKDSLITPAFVDTIQATPKYYTVKAVNSAGSSEPTTKISSDNKVNSAPQWSSTDTIKVTLKPDSTYTLRLSDKCTDAQGDSIHFSIVPDLLKGDTIKDTTYILNAPSTGTGTFLVALLAKDPQGLSDTLWIKVTLTQNSSIDTIPPKIKLTFPVSDSAIVMLDSIRVNCTVTDESGIASVECKNGAASFTVEKVTDTTFVCIITKLTAGEFSKITIIATDGSVPANTTQSNIFLKYEQAIIEPTIPVILLKNPEKDSSRVSTASITCKFECVSQSGIAAVACFFGGKAIPVTMGTSVASYLVDISVLTVGSNTITIIATDASKYAHKTTKTFTVFYEPIIEDFVAPKISLQSPKEDSSQVSVSSLTVEVLITDPSGIASVTSLLGDNLLPVTKVTDSIYSVTISKLSIGENKLTITAKDASTKANTTKKIISIFYDPTMTDTVPPVLSLKSPVKDTASVSSSSLTVEVLCTDLSDVASVTCTFGGKDVPTTKGASNNYLATVNGLVEGQNTITFTATDASYNANKAERNVTIIYDPSMTDNVAPVMKLKKPAKSGVQIAEDFIIIEIECKDDNGIASVTASRAGKEVKVTNSGAIYSAEITKLAPGKDETITFVATDKSSNANKGTLEVTVQHNTPIAKVTAQEPPDKATGVELTPSFSWIGGEDPDGDAVYFKVNYGTSSSDMKMQTSEKTGGSILISSNNALAPFTTYYWQVTAYSKSNDDKQQSAVLSFTTKGVAPTIDDSKLKDVPLKSDDKLTLSVKATGAPEPTYQWYKGNNPIDGAKSATYEISKVTETDAGTYYVMVSNEVKVGVKSKEITVTVVALPKITGQPVKTSVRLGEEAKFTVIATGSGLKYQWQKGGSPITTKGNEATYTISKTMITDDSNKFRCVVSNSAGEVLSDEVQLIVLYSVTYDPNGGEKAPIDDKTYPKNSEVTLLQSEKDKPTWTDHEFLGWNTDSKATKPLDTKYTLVQGDVTFYAIWKEQEFKVTFKSQGSKDVVVTVKAADKKVKVLPTDLTPPESDVVFGGWVYESDKKTPFTSSIEVKSSFSVVAVWTKIKTYSVTYYNESVNVIATLPIDNNNYAENASFTVLSIVYEAADYEFDKWTIKENGTSDPYEVGKEYPMGTSNINLYAQWKEKAEQLQ